MRVRDERGQVSVLIIGFAAVLLLAIAVVIDASAAYLQRKAWTRSPTERRCGEPASVPRGEDVYRGGVPDGESSSPPPRPGRRCMPTWATSAPSASTRV